MVCCHGKESSAHQKSKPSTLQCPDWDTRAALHLSTLLAQ